MKSEQILNQEEHDHELPSILLAFSAIYNGNTKQISYADTYNSVYKLCKRGMADNILKQLKTVSIQKFQYFLQKIDNKNSQIKDYIDLFTKIEESGQRISQILLYIQSNYINDPKRQHHTIKQILNSLFFTQLCKNRQILLKISQLICQTKITQNKKQIYTLIQCINKLDQKQLFLSQYFSQIFINKMSTFLQNQFKQNYINKQLKLFLRQTKQKIQQQRIWLKTNFMRNKGKKLIQEIIKKIYDNSLSVLKQQIYKEKQNQLFKNTSLQFLELLNQKNQIKEINDFNQWYTNQIKNILVKMDRSNNTRFLRQFIREYLNVSQNLSGIKNFNIGYKALFFFQHWINQDKMQFPRRLNIYFEDLFIKNWNTNEEGSQKRKEDLNNFGILFKFLKEKDYFQKQFRRTSALRIIYDTEKRGQDMQNVVITQMANQCGADWAFKLRNLKLATQQTQKIKDLYTNNFRSIVFQDTAWPFEKLQRIPRIRTQLLSLAGRFKQNYQQVFKGRSLQWHPLQGFVILNVKFNQKIQQFKMDMVMATILLTLQQSKYKSSLKQILQSNNLPIQKSQDQLQILLKQQIIKSSSPLKNPQNLNITIQLNLDYKPANQTLLIDFTYRYLSQQFIQKHGHEQLKNQRKMMIQALIVKIMKSNKEIQKQQLYQQITPMIQGRGFKFNKTFVQNCFVGLMDKRYIKELENGKYCYLAS